MNAKNLLLKRETALMVNVVLFACALVFLIMLVRGLFPEPIMLDKIEIGEERGSSVGTRSFSEYSVVLEKSPFGIQGERLTALADHSGSEGRIAVNVNYKLIGTIAEGGGRGFAIFLQSDGKQVLYGVGDTIPGLGILEEVDKDSVLIMGTEGKDRLELAEIKSGPIVNTPVRSGAVIKRNREFVRRGAGGSYILNSDMVQESINNPQRLMTDARLFPRYKNGEQEGFILKEVRKGGIYDSLGLKNGDILLRVNEYDITDPEKALQAFTALKGVERLQLDVIRSGAKVTQTYLIR
ncbi:MAG: hypothetical protein JSV21_04995 [Nitrospirota bacterium]|nr:MAG: hypothetical protein JSV21_04995 [Nitrospirota bacterium]